ncbi:hypothetical protein PI125_g13070 [Phytophthora idaei]|nr:hypothetical protein PI125_g13070 [Phytophthora idaei]
MSGSDSWVLKVQEPHEKVTITSTMFVLHVGDGEPACNRRLPALLKDLKKVESVSKAIQGVDASLLDARVWLDGLISIKPHYARFIGTRAEIVHSPDFEAGSGLPEITTANTQQVNVNAISEIKLTIFVLDVGAR